MPSAANGEVDKHAAIPVESSPIRRVVEILQDKIVCLEKQRNKLTSGRDVKSGKEGGELKGVSATKAEEISQMLEFVWDLCKQAMGIAILSENEAKKQARKESAARKAQDTQLVRDVLLVLDCLEQLNEPATRSHFLAGSCGAAQLQPRDLQVLDDIYPEVSPRHCPEEGMPSFQVQTMNAAKHLVAIIDGSPKEVIGTTYANIKDVVSTVHECGFLDNPRESRVEELEEEVAEVEELVEYVPLPTQSPVQAAAPPAPTPTPPAPPPPAPQTVPTPSFPLIPSAPLPVTLQQIEKAYFAQQYGHQQKPPIPEVFGPQSFIFLQESEIDTPETTRQPSPRPISPMPIPSQTFTNQNFTIPSQHFTPDLAPSPHMNINNLPQPALYQTVIPEVPQPHIPGFPPANPPPPIPMPPSHPVHPHMPQGAHQPQALPLPRLPSPSFQQNIAYKQPTHSLEDGSVPPSESSQEDTQTSSPERQDTEYGAWNEGPIEDSQPTQPLEINEWMPAEHTGDQESESNSQNDGQYAPNKFRTRARGRGPPSGNFRSRGGYQNGGRPYVTYYRNNDSYQGRENNGGYQGKENNGGYQGRDNNSNGGSFNESYREQGGYKGGRGRMPRADGRGGSRGTSRTGPPRGGPRAAGPRKTSGGGYEARGGADTKQYAH